MLRADFIHVCVGILQNVVMITEAAASKKAQTIQTIDSLKNTYLGELKSLTDDNFVTVIFLEEGFSPLTQTLLESKTVILLKNAKRQMSGNLEIYLDVVISE